MFWKVQPLIDAFNQAREDGFTASWKLCADESMSEWRGRDHRHKAGGCPHVTKIIRKPKGVGMEIKNLCDVDSGIMLRIEVVGPKEEMNDREYTRALGAGTALLLRLTKDFRGSGRIVVADSAFASVKTAVELKSRGLNFIGLVKTASRKFPKKWLQEVDLEERGDHYVLTATESDVNLRAVTWNEGKKDKKTGKIIRKSFISTCGTTLEAPPHEKKRWNNNSDGTTTYYTKKIKQPQIVHSYFQGAQQIDVHNHYRQGWLQLESRDTNRWDWRFFQTFVGICEVDAFLAYKRFWPAGAKERCAHIDFVLELIASLLDNTFGCTGPVLRPRAGEIQAESPQKGVCHDLALLTNASYFRRRQQEEPDHKVKCILKCKFCKKTCSYYCSSCSSESPDSTKGIVALCGPGTGRGCFVKHQLPPGSRVAGTPPHR